MSNSPTNTAPPRHPGDASITAGSIAILLISLLPVFLAPLVAHEMQKRGLTAPQAGALVGVSQGGLAVGALATAALSSKLLRLPTAVTGGVVSALGWALAWAAGGLGAAAVGLALAGLGAGICSATGNATLSGARISVRAFAIATITTVLLGSALIAAAPALESVVPSLGLAAPVIAVIIIAGALVTGVPALRYAVVHANPPASTGRSSHALASKGVSAQLLAGMLLLSVGTLGLWTFAQSIGESTGLPSATVTTALALTQVVGLLGAWLAAVAGRGAHRRVVLPVAIAVVAMGTLAMGTGSSGWAFLAGLTAVNLGYYCFTPLVYAIGADLDRSGRLAALVGSAGLVGGFLAPFAAGALAGTDEHWNVLGIAAAVAIAVSAVLLAVPAARAAQATAPAADRVEV